MKRLIFLLILLSALTGCPADQASPNDFQAASPERVETAEEPEVIKNEPIPLLISCVGDVMVHLSQINAQYDSASDTYDFSNNFLYITKYIEGSDLALFNLETTFGGRPYTGYPVFSAPDELAKALRSAGFNIAITANNHMLDRGESGLRRTNEVLRDNGFLVTGSVENGEQEPRYVIAEAKGLKIAVVAHTYASGNLLLNGSAVPKGTASLINYFRYDHIDEDLDMIKEIVAEAKNAGADIVIAYYHWGEEYQLKSNEFQRYIAGKTVNEIGADIIFASHPHTLQEIDFITNEATKKRVPVFYSMGNFISNQRVETLDVPNSRYTEIGIIAQVNLEYDENAGEITCLSAGAIPIWVEKYKSNGRDTYVIIPLDDDLESNETLAASGHLNRAKKAWEDANAILGIN